MPATLKVPVRQSVTDDAPPTVGPIRADDVLPQVTPVPPVAPVIVPPVAMAIPNIPAGKQCAVEENADGTLTVSFIVTAPQAQVFKRQACGKDLDQYVWNMRGLRHFEHQAIG